MVHSFAHRDAFHPRRRKRAKVRRYSPPNLKQIMTRDMAYRWFRITLIVLGAIAGAILPFVTHGGSSPRFTDIEARMGYGAFAALVNGAYGALAGWAVGELASYILRRR